MAHLLNPGDNVLVSHRRLFERDEVRYFAGTVESFDDGIVKLAGWTFLKDFASGNVIRKDDRRTKLFAVASGTIIVYQLPAETQIDALTFAGDPSHLVLTDGNGFAMDLSEHASAAEH